MDIKEQRRERFEAAFIKSFKNTHIEPMIERGLAEEAADTIIRVMALERDESGDYKAIVPRERWAGFNLALDSVEIEPVEQFGEPNPDSYDHRRSDPKYLADKAEFEANQARDALWIAAIEAAGLQVKP